MPNYLLDALIRLHSLNFAKVRCGKMGELSAWFPVQRGVRQGCVLAPTLFCLYINGLVKHLLAIKDMDAPKLSTGRVPTPMFADDTLLLSRTATGIQRVLDEFADFCALSGLEINLAKTKYMIFNPPR